MIMISSFNTPQGIICNWRLPLKARGGNIRLRGSRWSSTCHAYPNSRGRWERLVWEPMEFFYKLSISSSVVQGQEEKAFIKGQRLLHHNKTSIQKKKGHWSNLRRCVMEHEVNKAIEEMHQAYHSIKTTKGKILKGLWWPRTPAFLQRTIMFGKGWDCQLTRTKCPCIP